MRLFSEFWTRPKVRNRSKRHFAKFLPFAGLCNLFAAFKQVVKQSSIISADTAGHVQNPVEVLEQLRKVGLRVRWLAIEFEKQIASLNISES